MTNETSISEKLAPYFDEFILPVIVEAETEGLSHEEISYLFQLSSLTAMIMANGDDKGKALAGFEYQAQALLDSHRKEKETDNLLN